MVIKNRPISSSYNGKDGERDPFQKIVNDFVDSYFPVDRSLFYGDFPLGSARVEVPESAFRVGDHVVLKTGASPQIIREMRVAHGCELQLRTEYLSGLNYRGVKPITRFRPASDYLKVDLISNKEEGKVAKLYQVKGQEVFGTYLATNSEGKIVLEIKGANGEPRAFKPDEIEIVQPYTITARSPTNGSKSFRVAKGSVEVNDLIIAGGDFFVVTKLDTKNENAQVLKSARLVKTSPLEDLAGTEDLTGTEVE